MTPPSKPSRPNRGRRPKRTPAGGTRPGRPWQRVDGGPVRVPRSRTETIEDPLTKEPAELRYLEAFESHKEYICPGCNQEIRPGTRHVVIVPFGQEDMRRHWHEPCLARARKHGFK
jgi:hypothetical protein